MFYSVIFVTLLFFHNIELFGIADKLDYWTRYPKPEVRRAYAVAKTNNTTNQDEKVQFRFKKVKGTTNIDKKHSRSSTVARAENGDKFTPVSEAHYRVNGRYRDLEVPVDQKKPWPKLQHRARQKDIIRSTRLTPIYLMQHEEPTTTVKSGEESENDELSPYSLMKDMLELEKSFPGANITSEVIGRTAEYNDIVMLKIAERKSEISKYFRADDSKYVDEVPEKKIIFIVHGLSLMGFALIPALNKLPIFKELLSYYFAHLDKFDIFLIPMANPDGYSRRHEIWNKNMSPQGACSGVALDRNFDVSWNHSHTTSSCSQHYPGPSPFSEPESRAIREVLHHYSHKINAYCHVHAGSYANDNLKGDAVLYPKGYTDVQTDDDKYIDLRGEIDEAMKNASFQVLSVTVDTLHNWYGKILGSSVDYASTVYGIPYAMEFVMQPYKEDHLDASDELSVNALREVWKRVIDVLFNNIWRNTKNNEI